MAVLLSLVLELKKIKPPTIPEVQLAQFLLCLWNSLRLKVKGLELGSMGKVLTNQTLVHSDKRLTKRDNAQKVRRQDKLKITTIFVH